jgi:glucose-1-phosphate thymidylyltransferase
MKAVLLAAGMGKRLEPITNFLPKPMIKICGKPLIEYIVDDLSDSGFNDICVIVGHESDQIISYFDTVKKQNVKISFITQDEFKGTAHASLCAKNFVGTDSFLLYLSDTLIPFDLQNFLSKIKHDKHDISILSSKVFLNDLTSVGNIIIENEFVKEISEKSKNPKSGLAWAGVAFFNDNSIFDFIRKLSLSENNEYDLTEAMNLALKNNKNIKNYLCKKFIDCGTIKGLLDGLKSIIDINTSKQLIENKSLSYVDVSSTLGKNVIIGPYTSIEKNVTIGDNVKISESILLENTIVPSNRILNKSILSSYGEISSNDNIL